MSRRLGAVGALSLILAACGSGASASNTSSSGGSSTTAAAASSSSTITLGELMPMSGKEAFVGQWFDHGVKAGIEDVNANGGVMGKKFKSVLEDTAGDPVDAVTAWHTLQLHKPAVVLGPSSLSIMGVINDFQTSKIVDIMEGGTTQLDKMQYPYVYRVFPSDSALLTAEAYYAVKKDNCTTASLMYTSDANAQAEVPPIQKAFKTLGGTIVSNLQIQAGQSSYLSEVSKAFAKNPQCVFFHADPQTAATLFSNVRQLGHMNVKFITGDTGASVQLAKAFGLSDAAKYMVGMGAPPAYSQAEAEYLKAYDAVWHTKKSLPAAPAMYDGVIIAALAMDAAHSITPSVYRPYITKVSNSPGTKCYTYASCYALLKKGTKINYQGASGPEDFNKYHNVFSDFTVVQFDTSGNTHVIDTVKASQVASVYSGA